MPGCVVQLGSNFVQFDSCFLTNSVLTYVISRLASAIHSNGGVTLSRSDKFNLGLVYTKTCLWYGAIGV